MAQLSHPTVTQPSRVVVGMTIMAAAMLMAPGMDAIAKYLGTVGEVAPGVTTFGRFLVQAVILFALLSVLVVRGRKQRILPKNLLGNLARGCLMGIAAFMFFTAVTFMPVADAIAIFFVEPFIVTILSAILLGEVVGWRRRVAVLVGFAGALLVIQPSFQEVGLVTLLPVATAFVFSFYLILTRKIASENDDPLAMQCVAGIGGTIVMALALLIGGQLLNIEPLEFHLPQTEGMWSLIILLGLLGTISHLMIVVACSKAPASILAPFQYIEIVSATILGFIIFSDFPSPIKWLGIFIIIGSGIYIFLRERKISNEEEGRSA